MSLEGFLRMAWGPLVGAAVVAFVTWLCFHYTFKWLPKQEDNSKSTLRTQVHRLRSLIYVLIAVCFGIWLISVGAQNLFPRADIDRFPIDQENQDWEREHSTPLAPLVPR